MTCEATTTLNTYVHPLIDLRGPDENGSGIKRVRVARRAPPPPRGGGTHGLSEPLPIPTKARAAWR